MGNHMWGGEEAGGFDTLVDVIRQRNGWHAFIMWYPASRGPSIFPTYLGRSKGLCLQGNHVVVFNTKVLYFKIENTPIKDTSGKRKFKRMLRFLFVDKREFFSEKLSFEEFNLVFFTACQSAWLVLNQPRQRGFWRNLRYILYSMVIESTFWKGIFVFRKVSWTFWHRRERKTTKCAFEIDFLPRRV